MLVDAGYVLAGVALWVLEPPTHAAEAGPDGGPFGVRGWLTARLLTALAGTTAAVAIIFGAELTMIASLQTTGQAAWIPLVNAVWCLASLVGGLGYGAARRSRPLPLLVGLLGLATLPVALGGSWWSFALLLIPPACSSRPR